MGCGLVPTRAAKTLLNPIPRPTMPALIPGHVSFRWGARASSWAVCGLANVYAGFSQWQSLHITVLSEVSSSAYRSCTFLKMVQTEMELSMDEYISERVFSANCPYCYTRNVAFTIKHQGDGWYELGCLYRDTFATCGKCGRAVVTTFRDKRLYKMAPSPPEPPMHVTDDVMNYFRQGVANLSGNYDAAGAMFRTTLETALKEKLPDSKASSLYHRIEEAKEQQKLTPDLAKYGHIRYGLLARKRYMIRNHSRGRTRRICTTSPSWFCSTYTHFPEC